MKTYRLERVMDGPLRMSGKIMVQLFSSKLKDDRKEFHILRDRLSDAFGLPRPVATAVLFGEINLRVVKKNGTLEFNWPNDGSLEDY